MLLTADHNAHTPIWDRQMNFSSIYKLIPILQRLRSSVRAGWVRLIELVVSGSSGPGGRQMLRQVPFFGEGCSDRKPRITR